MEKVNLKMIENHTERDILLLLDEKEKCMMGEIFMTLKLSYRKGKKHLISLMNKNWISNTEKAPYFTLKIELE